MAHCYRVPPAKLCLVNERSKSRKIRCGIILPSDDIANTSAFLSALVADVYSPNQSWFNVFKQRYYNGNSLSSFLVKYGDQFEKQKLDNMTTYTIPSPFLQKNNVEFLETQRTDSQDNDGCHFYINLQGANPDMFHIWPTLNISVSGQVTDLPFENQVNAPLALKAISSFIRNKDTVNEFLDAMTKSDFTNIQKKLESKLLNTDGIFENLENSVLENILKTERLLDKNQDLDYDEQEYLARVEQWSEQAHEELQNKIIPRLKRFVKIQLSLWRVYTYSESKLQLKLLNTIAQPLCGLQMVNLLNRLRGELNVSDSSTVGNQLLDIKQINEKATAIHKRINKVIYQNFVLVQLPMILLATFGVVSGEFSAFSMGSLASFGVILGFSRVLTIWQSLLDKYMREIRENIRRNIEVEKSNLVRKHQESFSERKLEYKTKLDLCRSLNANKTRNNEIT